jgi:hypothetical protein
MRVGLGLDLDGAARGGGGGAFPSFMPIAFRQNPPDIFMNFKTDQAWRKSNGVIVPASSLLTAGRTSAEYVVNSAGLWTSFAANIPAVTDKGLSVWEGRTQRVRNNSMQGASVGSGVTTRPTNWNYGPGTSLTISTVGFGTDAATGIDYIDIRVQGTASDGALALNLAFDNRNDIPAASGQVWSNSVFLALVAGAFWPTSTVVFAMDEQNSSHTHVQYTTGASFKNSITGTLTRFENQLTVANASTAFISSPGIWISGAGAGNFADFTLRVGWPQFEQGAFATPPIRTTAGEVGRVQDKYTLNLSGLPAIGSAYSLYGKATHQAPTSYYSTSPGGVVSFDDGTGANRVAVRNGNGGYNFVSVGGTPFNVGVGTWGAGGKAAVAVAVSDQRGAGGGALTAAATSAALPSSLSTVVVGSSANGTSQFTNGFVEEAAFWFTQRVSNTQLQAFTV